MRMPPRPACDFGAFLGPSMLLVCRKKVQKSQKRISASALEAQACLFSGATRLGEASSLQIPRTAFFATSALSCGHPPAGLSQEGMHGLRSMQVPQQPSLWLTPTQGVAGSGTGVAPAAASAAGASDFALGEPTSTLSCSCTATKNSGVSSPDGTSKIAFDFACS